MLVLALISLCFILLFYAYICVFSVSFFTPHFASHTLLSLYSPTQLRRTTIVQEFCFCTNWLSILGTKNWPFLLVILSILRICQCCHPLFSFSSEIFIFPTKVAKKILHLRWVLFFWSFGFWVFLYLGYGCPLWSWSGCQWRRGFQGG